MAHFVQIFTRLALLSFDEVGLLNFYDVSYNFCYKNLHTIVSKQAVDFQFWWSLYFSFYKGTTYKNSTYIFILIN